MESKQSKSKSFSNLPTIMLFSASAFIMNSASFKVHASPLVQVGSVTQTSSADSTNKSLTAPVITPFTQAEIEQMLAPIALYPDTLLTHILIAATYPIEVIEADRLVKANENSSEFELKEKVTEQDWDPSVQALASFPTVLAKLSEDLTWMQKLGDAFLQDEKQVLASIQLLRQKADDAGNLSQMDNVEIVREKQTIVIESTQPEVIYVPYYDTRVVYGSWYWRHHPPVYWHRPVHYSYYHGPFYWHSGVHLAYNFFSIGFHWQNHHVVHHHHKKHHYYSKHHSSKRVSTSHEAKRWRHNPKHRKGVAYRTKSVKKRYVSHSNVNHRPTRAYTQKVRHQEKVKRLSSNKSSRFASNNVVSKSRYQSSKQQNVTQRLNNKQSANKPVKVKTSYAKQASNQTHKRNTQYKTSKSVRYNSDYLQQNRPSDFKQNKVNNRANTQSNKNRKPVYSADRKRVNYDSASPSNVKMVKQNKPVRHQQNYQLKSQQGKSNKSYTNNKSYSSNKNYSNKSDEPSYQRSKSKKMSSWHSASVKGGHSSGKRTRMAGSSSRKSSGKTARIKRQ